MNSPPARSRSIAVSAIVGLTWAGCTRMRILNECWPYLQRILEGHAKSLAYAARLGVRTVAGSDAGSHGVAHGHGFLTELELMERAGLSTLQVLRSATAANAARLGFDEIFDAIVATASFENLQRFDGTDVMARIQYDSEHPGRLLQRTLLGYLRRAIADYPVEPHSIWTRRALH